MTNKTHYSFILVTRRSAYNTGGIPMLDGDTQTSEYRNWVDHGSPVVATNVLEKNVAGSSPRAHGVSLQVEQNSTDRTTLCILLICGPRRQRQLCKQQIRGRGATGSRGSIDPPLFQVRGPHMARDPHFFCRVHLCPICSCSFIHSFIYSFIQLLLFNSP